MIYDLIAPIYDEINAELDYSAWADFVEKLFDKFLPKRPELVLDLCCGSGRMTVELAKRGYDMTGVDYSEEMLGIARETAEREGVAEKNLWLLQDMRAFELYGTVGACLCCLDSINHLTSPKDLDACLSLVHNYLDPDGLFIFDVNGREKFETVYGQTTYSMDLGDRFCVWQNDYDSKKKICDFYITLFSEDESGKYERYDEVQSERMYTLRSLKKHLEGAGFELLGAYSDFDFTEGSDASERIYIAAKCIKTQEI